MDRRRIWVCPTRDFRAFEKHGEHGEPSLGKSFATPTTHSHVELGSESPSAMSTAASSRAESTGGVRCARSTKVSAGVGRSAVCVERR
jgi:hypothetical protein